VFGAIAELIDNAIDAKAKSFYIDFHQGDSEGSPPAISFLDDGMPSSLWASSGL
jgi:DNA mismatch repair ATPase MutL